MIVEDHYWEPQITAYVPLATCWRLAAIILGLVIFSGTANGQSEKTVAEQLRAREWYLPTEDGSTELYVTEIGQGDTVVVLHGGWGAEHGYLVETVQGLEDQFHFVFYDQRGSLRSPIPDDKADSLISVQKHVEDLETLREELGMDQIILLGHSMGSVLATLYLREYPERAQGLILLSAPPPPPALPLTAKDSTMYRERERLGEAFGQRQAIADEIAEEGLDRDSLSAKEETFRWKINYAGVNLYDVERWRQKKGGRAFYDTESARAASQSVQDSVIFDIRAVLRQFDGPIPVILGDHDHTDMGGRIWKTIAAEIPAVDLHLIEKAGHSAWIDQPTRFRKVLNCALRRVTRE